MLLLNEKSKELILTYNFDEQINKKESNKFLFLKVLELIRY